jgi:hypothetical protein
MIFDNVITLPFFFHLTSKVLSYVSNKQCIYKNSYKDSELLLYIQEIYTVLSYLLTLSRTQLVKEKSKIILLISINTSQWLTDENSVSIWNK